MKRTFEREDGTIWLLVVPDAIDQSVCQSSKAFLDCFFIPEYNRFLDQRFGSVIWGARRDEAGWSASKLHREQFHELQNLGELIMFVENFFAAELPEQYAKQIDLLPLKAKMISPAFSTLTVNKNWQPPPHRDIIVPGTYGAWLTIKKRTGGNLIFPEREIEIKAETGDLVIADFSELHYVSPCEGERLGLIFHCAGIA